MKTSRLVSLLLLSTTLAMPSLARAQDASATGDAATLDDSLQEKEIDISIPGGEIIVTGQRDRNITRIAPQVVTVLSAEEIARTGEGDIAGALGRVTGLSVVGSGYVYVRGLGDRYSLALLNGSPLPSPEPLKRVVPLDLFPTSVMASTLVQKSYSANFPGEFGGGVINLTTKATPDEGFFTIGGGISADTESTGQLGYTYYGSATDWTGVDNGQRDIRPALAAFLTSGERISSGNVDTTPIAQELINSRNSVIQKWDGLPANFSASVSGGKTWDIGDTRLGVIAAAGYSNKWSSRGSINQTSLDSDLSQVESDFYQVSTDNRIVVNGLLGLGFEFGEHKLRWTNLLIRDTVKNARLSVGEAAGRDWTYMRQNTGWYDRQLINTQLVGEFEITPEIGLDLRGVYANSKRDAPEEISFLYVRTNNPADELGDTFINRLDNGQRGDARISYSYLNEDLWSGGADLNWRFAPGFNATIGYAYTNTERTSSRRDFQLTAPSDLPSGVDTLRPDLLLQPAVIDYFNIALIDTNEGNPAFLATLESHAGYGKLDAQITDDLSIDIGVRYETAEQVVSPIQVFTVPGASNASTNLNNDYWLPTATITWNFVPDMQFRLNASKTIARPQFRELLYQSYFDPESNRQYQGNPLLVDSELLNAEARWEWYFDRDQRLSVAAFYKKIDRPIETYITGDNVIITSFANSPAATLYGAEIELQKYFDVSSWGNFFNGRRVVLVGNYTFSESALSVKPDDTVAVFGAFSTIASDYFDDGAPLTGQSRHIANAQIGFESQDKLSQQTVLISYASKRVASRGLNNTTQPDVIEYPGIQLDFVAREGVNLLGVAAELKFEARNILGTKHQEYQSNGTNRIDHNTYDVGRTFSLSASVTF